jgi:hypothetical protein
VCACLGLDWTSWLGKTWEEWDKKAAALVGEELLSLSTMVTSGWVDTYCGAVSTAVLSFLMIADYIPKGASRGAATPIGALLRKDMASVCGDAIQVLLLSRSQSSMAVCRSVGSSSR